MEAVTTISLQSIQNGDSFVSPKQSVDMFRRRMAYIMVGMTYFWASVCSLTKQCLITTWQRACLKTIIIWWRHRMETFSALLTLCAENSTVPAQRAVNRSVDVFFHLCLNKRLWRSLWRHCNNDINWHPQHWVIVTAGQKPLWVRVTDKNNINCSKIIIIAMPGCCTKIRLP